jgi:HPt (histidine-containing phosphotransfer) domain-containing protein
MTESSSLDPAALERLSEWGGEKLVGQMIKLFLDNSPARMDQIRAGVASGDPAESEKGSHSLKSSAANVGAQQVRDLSTKMEAAAVAGDAEAVSQILPGLEEAYSQAIAALEDVVKGNTE